MYITAPKLHPTKDEGADRPAGAAEGAAAGEEREGGTLFSSAMRISIGRQDVQCHKGLAYIIEVHYSRRSFVRSSVRPSVLLALRAYHPC